jgi:chromatin segregation and condensation protein Rec8/ScpA/Scc1 (kleisin family)
MSETTAVLGNFQINLPGPNGASMSVSGYLYADESQESLDARMDTLRESLMRQQQALEIPVLEERLTQLERTKTQIMEAYADLLEKQKRKTLPSAEASHLKNYPTQIKHIDEEIEKGKVKIASVKKAA